MKLSGKYQFDDPLTPEEFARLEADILERGVLVAIEFDEDGNVLDGHHRLAVCEKHGITDYPTVIRRGLSEEEKRTHARRANIMRRQLTREQVRQRIEEELQASPDSSNRAIAKACGVDHKTVGAARRRLNGEIPQRNGDAPKKDSDGNQIPEHLIGAFKSATVLRSSINVIRQQKQAISKLPKTAIDLRGIKRRMDLLIELIEARVPHAVHSRCEGHGCSACQGRGYTTGGEIPQLTSPTERRK